MRRLLLILALCASCSGQVALSGHVEVTGKVDLQTYVPVPPTAACADYTLDIPLSLVVASGSNQANFPVRFAYRDDRLKSAPNGGYIQNTATNSIGRTVPADLILSPTTSSATSLKKEVVYWDATTGDIEGWFQQPTYTSSASDTVHICAGNAAVTTSQDDLSLWSDVNYFGVYHFANGPDYLNSVDGVAGTSNGSPYTGFGSAGNGYSVADPVAAGGNTTRWVTIAETAAFKPSHLTIESYGFIETQGNIVSKPYSATVWAAPYASYNFGDATGNLKMSAAVGGTYFSAISTGTIDALTWNAMGATFDGSNIRTYLRGAADGITSAAGGISYGASTNIAIASNSPYPANQLGWWQGILDEIRLSSDAKSADWIATGAIVGNPYVSSIRPSHTTYNNAFPVQKTTCRADYPGATTCVMPFNVNSDGRGGIMVAIAAQLGSGGGPPYCPTGRIRDTLGLTYTPQVTAVSSGHVETYSLCIYTAPIPALSTGADTLTIASSNRDNAFEVYEVAAGTDTGLATASTNLDQPSTISASCSTTNCIAFCATTGGAQKDAGQPVTVSPSSYRLEQSTALQDAEDAPTTHPRWAAIAWDWVGSGSHSCSFSTTGYVLSNGVMAVIPYAP